MADSSSTDDHRCVRLTLEAAKESKNCQPKVLRNLQKLTCFFKCMVFFVATTSLQVTHLKYFLGRRYQEGTNIVIGCTFIYWTHVLLKANTCRISHTLVAV